MHQIEPHYTWRHLYKSSKDPNSPFYGVQHSTFHFTHKIYNYVVHPQWDYFGSDTLLLKVLFVDYDEKYAIIEMMGEWNDAINNDIMLLKRDVIDPMLDCGIEKFILLCENVINFHASDDSYYQEWWEDTPGGYVAFLHVRDHVYKDMYDAGFENYVRIPDDDEQTYKWKMQKPEHLFQLVDDMVMKQLSQ
ncbi:MAG: hypothetical protein ACI8ZN_002243 [Bacteroidia bacterium]|jgi:hypothetical protein